MSTETTTKEKTEKKTKTYSQEHERFSHYVDKDAIIPSAVYGTPIRALCGKMWIPSRDPKKYPICPTCKEIYDSLPEK